MYNIPFPSSDVQRTYNTQNVAYNRTPEVVGEGDLFTSTSPDGRVLMYFLPMLRRNPHFSPYQVNSDIQPASPEVWYIRSICNTNPYAYFSNVVPINNPATYDSNNFNSCNQNAQKFHNDNSTSTTDLRYFFPAPCRDKKLCICVAVQTEASECSWCRQSGIKNNMASSDKHMCVDDEESHYGAMLRRPHFVFGTFPKREQSDKLVATFTNMACGCANKGDCQTQTGLGTFGQSEESVTRTQSKRTGGCSTDCSCSYLT